MATTGKFREILRKYGKVGVAVHCSVSAISITSLYVAIKNNVDVESMLEKFGMGGADKEPTPSENISDLPPPTIEKKRNRTAELAASSGGAFAVALLLNKALFPVRVPITLALTPPIARFLARRNIIRTNV